MVRNSLELGRNIGVATGFAPEAGNQRDAGVVSSECMRTAKARRHEGLLAPTAGTATFYDGRQLFSRPDQRLVWRSIRDRTIR